MKAQHSIRSVAVPDRFIREPVSVLAELAGEHHLRWLLAHADDGVIWGEVRENQLHLSSDVFPFVSPPLRAETLQQARLFGPDAELLLWKSEDSWQARIIQDASGEDGEHYEETHLLWGTNVERWQDGFALLREGREGLRHAPPLPQNAHPPVRLRVRHYLAYDSDGQAYIAYSRLVGIESQGGTE
jgi:CRISPR-associated protein (TIGR03984 family)